MVKTAQRICILYLYFDISVCGIDKPSVCSSNSNLCFRFLTVVELPRCVNEVGALTVPRGNDAEKGATKSRQDTKAVKTAAVLMVASAICWLPMAITGSLGSRISQRTSRVPGNRTEKITFERILLLVSVFGSS